MKFVCKNVLFILGFVLLAHSQFAAAQSKVRRQKTVIAPTNKIVDFTQVLADAQKFFVANNYQKTNELAKSAISLNPNSFVANYFAAYSLFKQNNFSEAQVFADQSLKLFSSGLPENSFAITQMQIEQLILDISNSKSGVERLKLAEQAITEGNELQAAESFESAYQFLPNREEIGIRAARIYLLNLSETAKSIKLLKLVLLRTADNTSESIKVATDLLKKAQDQIVEADELAKVQQHTKNEAEKQKNLQLEEQYRLREEREKREKYIRELESEISDLESKISNYESEIRSNDSWVSHYLKFNDEVSANEYRRKVKRAEENLREANIRLDLLKEERRKLKYSN